VPQVFADLVRAEGKTEVLESFAGRNRCFFLRAGSIRYVLKHFCGSEAHSALRNELRASDIFSGIAPAVRAFDVRTNSVLYDYVDAWSVPYSDTDHFTNVGEHLARLHGSDQGAPPAAQHGGIGAASLPAAFSLHKPTWAWRSLRVGSPALLEATAEVQRSAQACRALDSLAHSWEATTACHMDLKHTNVLAAKHDKRNLTFIDWEMLGKGDPAWDVGLLWADNILKPISALSSGRAQVPDISATLAQARDAQRGNALILDAYQLQHSHFSARRAVMMSGAAMLQMAMEYAAGRPLLNDVAQTAIHLGLSILANPEIGERTVLRRE